MCSFGDVRMEEGTDRRTDGGRKEGREGQFCVLQLLPGHGFTTTQMAGCEIMDPTMDVFNHHLHTSVLGRGWFVECVHVLGYISFHFFFHE